MKKSVLSALTLVPLIWLAHSAFAAMSSSNYAIPSSVLSGGGAPMASANYQMNSTLGQSSPLMDPASPPFSANYMDFPGFWHTQVAACVLIGDLNGDGSVNIFDFGIFRANYPTGMICDLNGDGFVNIFDFGIFRANYGTSCP